MTLLGVHRLGMSSGPGEVQQRTLIDSATEVRKFALKPKKCCFYYTSEQNDL